MRLTHKCIGAIAKREPRTPQSDRCVHWNSLRHTPRRRVLTHLGRSSVLSGSGFQLLFDDPIRDYQRSCPFGLFNPRTTERAANLRVPLTGAFRLLLKFSDSGHCFKRVATPPRCLRFPLSPAHDVQFLIPTPSDHDRDQIPYSRYAYLERHT